MSTFADEEEERTRRLLEESGLLSPSSPVSPGSADDRPGDIDREMEERPETFDRSTLPEQGEREAEAARRRQPTSTGPSRFVQNQPPGPKDQRPAYGRVDSPVGGPRFNRQVLGLRDRTRGLQPPAEPDMTFTLEEAEGRSPEIEALFPLVEPMQAQAADAEPTTQYAMEKPGDEGQNRVARPEPEGPGVSGGDISTLFAGAADAFLGENRRVPAALARQRQERLDEEARAALEQRGAQERRLSAEAASERDPSSQRSREAQDALIAAVRSYGPGSAIGQSLTEERIRTMSANSIDRNRVLQTMLQNAGRVQVQGMRGDAASGLQAQRAADQSALEEQRSGNAQEAIRLRDELRRARRAGGGGGPGARVGELVGRQRELVAQDRLERGLDQDIESARAFASALSSEQLDRTVGDMARSQPRNEMITTRQAEGRAEVAERQMTGRQWQLAQRLQSSGLGQSRVAAGSALEALGTTGDADTMAAIAMLNSPTGTTAIGSLNPAARRVAQSVQRVVNIVLQRRSGAAVTDQEMARFAREAGVTQLSRQGLIEGIQGVSDLIEADIGTLERGAGVTPEQSPAPQRQPRRQPRPNREPGQIREFRDPRTGEWRRLGAGQEQTARRRGVTEFR